MRERRMEKDVRKSVDVRRKARTERPTKNTQKQDGTGNGKKAKRREMEDR